ncbi:kelch-like protein 10 [Physella acuta]|uniref:kelch-like protein 10 n=1 Tax=Physella acuta TaxID=109671 RepID=UPI0027DD10E8|nr:kelch-like protein 10 [Physella acuta]
MTGRKLPRRHQSSFKKSTTQDAASCDFTVVVDGTEFKSHREILSSASNYFDALFRSNMRETKEGRVELQGMTSETFAVVLNFIHQRVHGLTADNIDDIWEAANRLDIAIYLKEIEHFVIDNLSIDNLWHFYLKAVDFNSNNVKDGSVMFMKQNYEHVFRMNEFLNMPFELVLSCIEGEELNVTTEDSVLESILIWVSNGKCRTCACLSPDRSVTGATCKDIELQNSEGHSCDVTNSCQIGSVIKVGQNYDSGTVATDKPGINFRKQGQHDDVENEDHNDDVTKCSRTGERANYLSKLMSSAKLTLATVIVTLNDISDNDKPKPYT